MGSLVPVSSPNWTVQTRWSMVDRLRVGEANERRLAFESFYECYWRPIYAYIRARGNSTEDSEDLTQDYFCRLMQKGSLAKAIREKGKLRAFLITDLKFYLRDEWAKRTAEKRGGKLASYSIDVEGWEETFQRDLAAEPDPDQLFDRSWALTILEMAVRRLEQQYSSRGRTEVFSELRGFLSLEDEPDYCLVARTLGMEVNAVQSAVHRMRAQFRRLLRECVDVTLAADADDLEEEMRYLQRVLSA